MHIRYTEKGGSEMQPLCPSARAATQEFGQNLPAQPCSLHWQKNFFPFREVICLLPEPHPSISKGGDHQTFIQFSPFLPYPTEIRCVCDTSIFNLFACHFSPFGLNPRCSPMVICHLLLLASSQVPGMSLFSPRTSRVFSLSCFESAWSQ